MDEEFSSNSGNIESFELFIEFGLGDDSRLLQEEEDNGRVTTGNIDQENELELGRWS